MLKNFFNFISAWKQNIFLNMAKCILVTGGAGFIGSHSVIELVNGGYETVVVDNFTNASAGWY